MSSFLLACRLLLPCRSLFPVLVSPSLPPHTGSLHGPHGTLTSAHAATRTTSDLWRIARLSEVQPLLSNMSVSAPMTNSIYLLQLSSPIRLAALSRGLRPHLALGTSSNALRSSRSFTISRCPLRAADLCFCLGHFSSNDLFSLGCGTTLYLAGFAGDCPVAFSDVRTSKKRRSNFLCSSAPPRGVHRP